MDREVVCPAVALVGIVAGRIGGHNNVVRNRAPIIGIERARFKLVPARAGLTLFTACSNAIEHALAVGAQNFAVVGLGHMRSATLGMEIFGKPVDFLDG